MGHEVGSDRRAGRVLRKKGARERFKMRETWFFFLFDFLLENDHFCFPSVSLTDSLPIRWRMDTVTISLALPCCGCDDVPQVVAGLGGVERRWTRSEWHTD
jgi:hypothetical protein